ncbi:transcriptional repressor [Pelistega europaea]|uniref:Ferric uptake regulation protein n=1 Tax=Pelistega europaea TaxID=106147 RepID=A0A7Y4LBL8_9BURK|nr:transcriptional repressor [Pelistega europaea]NOL49331.1 transcriptional repressor [Pelistega europaea]
MDRPHAFSPDTNHKLAEAAALCESRGKRLTTIRAQVLGLMLDNERSLKAYELLDKMQEIHPSSKPATVYRALEFLEEEGFIHRLDAINGWTACQHIHADAHEHHDLLAVCTECGAVREIRAPQINEQLHDLLAQVGFSQNAPQTEIRATCTSCQQKHASSHTKS